MDYKKEIEELINTVVREAGSDLHISAGRSPSIRISGELIVLVKHQPYSKEDALGLLKELLSKEKLETFLKEQEIDFAYAFKNIARLRGNRNEM